MNVYQKIAFATGFIFITFIVILAIFDFNNVILVLGFFAILILISGTVKIILLHERRKAVLRELDEFRENRIKSMEKELDKVKKAEPKGYYCGICFYQTDKYSKMCPECGKGPLIKSGGKK